MAVEPRRCPVCASTDVQLFLRLDRVPVLCNVLLATASEAREVPRGEISLGICRACTHIYNYTFEPERLKYTEAYDNSLFFSPRFRAYARELVEDLMKRYDVTGKTVLDIGCGKGEFLSLLCTVGNNRGVGFDASFQPEHARDIGALVTIIQDDYSQRYAGYTADLICSRHVIEHVADPGSFVQLLHAACLKTQGAVMYAEVPNTLWILQERRIWDVIYEHCSYFTSTSLRCLFQRNGFDVLRLYEGFDRQYLSIECRAGEAAHANESCTCTEASALVDGVVAFASEYHHVVDQWNGRLQDLASAGKQVVLWGGGSKGVTFLNQVQKSQAVTAVVDVNPRKQGKYVPGTGHTVIAPEDLRHLKPDVVIVMNPAYIDEIHLRLRWQGLAPEILLA